MKLEKIVYESPNDENIIFEADDAYLLVISDKMVWFDKNIKILDAVVECIETYGHFKYHKAVNQFVCNHDLKTIYLKNLIFTVGRNFTEKKIKGHICSKDGDSSNCFLSNLKLDQTLVTAAYGNDGQPYIFIMNEAKNAIAYTNYDEGLLNILSRLKFSYEDKHRWFICARNNNCRFQDFVWVYYHMPNTTIDNVFSRIAEFKKICHSNSEDPITIDHKLSDNNRTNNCVENLQLLPRSLNSKKGRWTHHLQPNCAYYVYNGSEAWFKRKVTKPFGFMDYEIYGLQDVDKGKKDIEDLVKFAKTGEMPEGKISLSIGTMINTLYYIDNASKMANRAKKIMEKYLEKYATKTK